MANEFKVRKGLIVQGSGSAILDIFGSQGQLFSVTDSLSGSLFSVNDISGIPIMEVFSDNTIKLGTYNQEAIIISGSRTGMGTALPQAELHISGANNDSLFRIQSPASSSIIFVSGSGNVGIGTLTPTQKVSVDNGNVGFTSGFGVSWDSDTEWIKRSAASDQLQFATQNTVRLNIGSTQGQLVAIGLGTTAASAQFQVRGGGATSATTAMRIEDSGGNARLTILDDGTSAFNTSHLYISSSGNVGIGTTSPSYRLDINGLTRIRSTNLLYFGGTGGGDWQGAISGQSGGLLVNLNVLTINNSGYSSPATQSFTINTSQNVAVGPHSPTARLHVSGASNAVLFEIDSPAQNNIIYVSGSGNVGIGTGTPSTTLQVVGGVTATSFTGSLFGTSSWAVNALTSSFITPTGTNAFVQDGNSFGTTAVLGTNDNQNLQFETSGSVRMHISSSGNVGIGTATPGRALEIVNSSAPQLRIRDGVSGGNLDLQSDGSGQTRITWGGNGYIAGEASALRVRGTSTAGVLIDTNAVNKNISLAPNDVVRLFVSSSGNVGIGTITPTEKLEVSDNVNNALSARIQNFNTSTNASSQLAVGVAGTAVSIIAYSANHTSRPSRIWINSDSAVSNGIWMMSDAGPLRFSAGNANGNHLFISSSGNVGIGTSTPSNTLNVNGTTFLQGGQTTVRGSGATSATTALRVENSAATARLTILDDGTSAFNTSHLYISSSGDVGIGTSTPEDKLNLVNGTLRIQTSAEKSIIRGTSFHSGLYLGNNIFYSGSGDPVTNSYYFLDSGSNNRNGNLLLIRANSSTTSLGGFYFYTGATGSVANSLATLTENFRILPSSSHFSNTRVGIGAAANASYAFDVLSSAPNAGAARINGNSTVWVFDQSSTVTRGNTTIARMVTMTMGPITATSGIQSALVISQSINQSSTAGYTALVVNANETATGSGNKLLQSWQFNGTNRTVINNSGSIGVGIDTPSASLHISGASNSNLLRIQSPAETNILFVTGSGRVGIGTSTPNSYLSVVNSGNIKLEAGDNVGIQILPEEWIHLHSDPNGGKYIRMDGDQISNSPPLTTASPTKGYGIVVNNNYLAEPDYWMEIKLGAAGGAIVLIPCYLPTP